MGGDQQAASNMAGDGSDEQSLGYCFASLQLAILEVGSLPSVHLVT